MCLSNFRSLGGLCVSGALGDPGAWVGLCRSYLVPEYGHRVAHERQIKDLNSKPLPP